MVARRWFRVVALVLPVAAGCYEARISNPDLWFLDVPTDAATPDEGPADPGTPDAVVPDLPVDVPADAPLPDKDRPTGSPCENDGQCWTGLCLTTAFVQTLTGRNDIDIPGGMCSYLYCSDSETECGPGGLCLDPTSLSADAPTLCVKPCVTDADCRSGYACPDLGLVDGGNVVKTCLPGGLVNLILCENGTCDEWEKQHPDACPADCPQ